MNDQKIKCPHLVKQFAYRCCMVDEEYCPSHFQLRAYCITGLHTICPFYLGIQVTQWEEREVMRETIN